MSSNVIDYFAILGRVNKNGLIPKPLYNLFSDTKEIIKASEILDEAITDIIILPNDQVPDNTWTLINTSLDNHQIDPPFLAIRRKIDSHRLDYITDIKIVISNDEIPKGYDLVFSPLTGLDSSSILCRGYLIIKRANTSNLRYFRCDPIIDDINVFKKSANEELPERYYEIDLIGGSLRDQENIMIGKNAVDISLILHVREGVGLCNMTYESCIIDRYPEKNYKGVELPVESLPTFAFPYGMKLTIAKTSSYPMPIFYTFVCTDEHGKHFYAACLQFYEEIVLEELNTLLNTIYGNNEGLTILDDYRIFCPKVICVVSQWPFYRSMRRFLRQIYSLSFSSLSIPLEYFIASVIGQVPYPIEGGRPFHLTLDAALISHVSKSMTSICFEVPLKQHFPLMDYDFAAPLRCFSVEVLLAIYTLMLRESKILFICKSHHILTEVMETLRSLLFPLTWSSCFVPRVPIELLGLLQAPGGFMIGAHVPITKYKSATMYLKELHSTRSLVLGTYVIDLTGNAIYQYTKKALNSFDTIHPEDLFHYLPYAPRCRLHLFLKKICYEYKIGPQITNLDEFDNPMEINQNMNPIIEDEDKRIPIEKWEKFPTLLMRDVFLVFMIDFLNDYQKYIIPPSDDLTKDVYRTFQEEFRIKNYLEIFPHQNNVRYTMELLLETQMFSALLQERSEGKNQALVFYDESSNLLRELGLNATGTSSIIELPAPIHILLSANTYWTCLSLPRQQQLKSFAVSQESNSNTRPISSNSSSSSSTLSNSKHNLIHYNSSILQTKNFTTFPVGSNHVVSNSKLDELLIMYAFMKSSNIHRASISLDFEHHVILKAREEINFNLDELHLSNSSFGPLIIPGPTISCIPTTTSNTVTTTATASTTTDTSSTLEQVEEDHDDMKSFNYQGSWETLSKSYLKDGEHSIHPRVLEIKNLRTNTILNVHDDSLLLVRSSNERLSFEQHGKLVNPISGLNANEDVSTVISLLIDVVDITLTLFALKSNYSYNPASDVLQMLGIMAQIEQWELISVLTEISWRSLLLGCINAGGDLMRQTSCVVYQCLNSFKRTNHIDTLTYGLYIRALGCKTRKVKVCKDNNTDESILDASIYLDDMGVTWYLQRIALYEQIELQSLQSHNHLESESSTSNSNSNNNRYSKSRGSSPVPSSSSPSKLSSQIKTEVIKLSSYKFDLISNDGLLRFKHPTNIIGLYPSIVLSNNIEDATYQLVKDVIIRMDRLYKDAIPLPKANQSSSASLSVTNSINNKSATRLSIGSSSLSNSVSNSPQNKSIHDLSKNNENNNIATASTFSSLRGRFFGGRPKTNNLPTSSPSNVATNSPAPPPPPTTTTTTTTTASPSTSNRWSFFPKTFSSPSSQSDININIPKIPQVRNSVVKLAATLNFEDEDAEDVNSDEENSDNKVKKSLSDSSTIITESVTESESFSESINTSILSQPLVEENVIVVSDDVVANIETRDLVIEGHSDSDIISDLATIAITNTEVNTEINDEINIKTTNIVHSETNLSESINDNKDQLLIIQPKISPALEEIHTQVDVTDIQNRILNTFHEEYIKQGTVIGINCSTPCSNCKYIMTEEEILALWSSGSGYDAHVKGNPRSRNARNMISTHQIICKGCSNYFTPMLHIHCYQKNPNIIDNTNPSSSVHTIYEKSSLDDTNIIKDDIELSNLRSIWSENVTFISSFGTRYELEATLLQYGDKVVLSNWLHAHNPCLYWCILWYSARFNLPSGLFMNPHECKYHSSELIPFNIYKYPIVISWRECVVKAKIYKLLTKNVQNLSEITLQDIFPQCNEDDIIYLKTEVSSRLDGSLYNMRLAILKYFKCLNIINIWQKDGFSNARIIYIGLLIICYVENKKNMITIPKTSNKLLRDNNMHSLAILSKDIPYDKIFVESIKCLFSSIDYDELQTTESELLLCSGKNQITAIIRNSFGFLF